MTRFFILIFAGISTLNTACCRTIGTETRKHYPDFYIASSERNKQLSLNEALFSITITNSDFEGYVENGLEVHASCNDQRFDYNLKNGLTHELKVKPGVYLFQFFIDGYEEIYSDSVTIEPGYRSDVRLRFREADYPVMEEKPVIYLYPQENLNVSVSVAPKGKMTFTYPEMGNGWNGTAHPDGSISINGKTYPYLFWEAEDRLTNVDIDVKKGFVVKGSEAITFLEKHLTEMGLNEHEQTDFITYWGPRLAANEQQYVHFLINESCEKIANLNISPAPDAIYRIFMVWSPVEAGTTLQPEPQQLPKMNRSGFHVVEWGGAELPTITQISMR